MRSSCNQSRDAHALRCELAQEVLRRSGKLRLQVRGWSMLPAIKPGDTLLVDTAKREAIGAGDIVLFGRDRRLFAHRVLKSLDHGRLLTRGDANPAPDPVVNEEELLGRISYIVRDGRAMAPRRSPGISARAIATFARTSPLAARIIANAFGRTQVN